MTSAFLRLPAALAFTLPVFFGQGAVWKLAREWGKVPVALLSLAIAAGLGWAAYALYTRLLERRVAHELGWRGAWREFGAGWLVGTLLFGVTIGVLALLGAYRVSGLREQLSVMTIPLCVSLAAAVIEEIVARGVVFRLLEESLGTWIALAISAALFGLGHLSNPNATPLAALAVAVEAGVLLAAAFVLTRRLWLAIGIHAAWNFTQSGIFGVPLSGIPMHGIVVGELAGPAWLSGGAFGAEGSVVAVLTCTALGVAMLALAWRRGHFVAPFWRRRGAAVGRATAVAGHDTR